ncbi:hypothetical protein DCS_02628 [Drechmeria coniospora]|uniref:Plasma membrane proteolipid 3 n=1 Tax=Drechmeria coniospora TaxID=98403 RepID=A0A151GWK2_DRECN|nr:hypothetical protein DCS_02628 [Drechmeria coniospora]KYK61486.1 hypothetical protein DCS_02628 [Drechmeria coniospora]
MGAVSAVLIVLITILCMDTGVRERSRCGASADEIDSPSIRRVGGGGMRHGCVPMASGSMAGRGLSLTRTDLFINICLTILGYLPGHIHAFYIEYVYYDRREQALEGRFPTAPAPGVYSDNVQTGGRGYGTMVPPGA